MTAADERPLEGKIHYPSYVNLDPFIDLARLRSLDSYLRERIEKRIARTNDTAFYTGPFLLEDHLDRIPGSRMIYLSRSRRDDDYYDLDVPDLWERSPEAEEFSELMDFIGTLPFQATGRMLIMYDERGRSVPAHRDHDSVELCHEFVWFRTNLEKPFYMLNPQSGEQRYVASHCAWFDTVNQYHGADETAALSYSIRIDGRFSDEFRSLIPFPERHRSAAASCWACS